MTQEVRREQLTATYQTLVLTHYAMHGSKACCTVCSYAYAECCLHPYALQPDGKLTRGQYRGAHASDQALCWDCLLQLSQGDHLIKLLDLLLVGLSLILKDAALLAVNALTLLIIPV